MFIGKFSNDRIKRLSRKSHRKTGNICGIENNLLCNIQNTIIIFIIGFIILLIGIIIDILILNKQEEIQFL